MTIRETLAEGTASLVAAGIENPGLDSSLLLAEVLGTSRSKLTAAGNDNLSQEAVAAFRRLIERRQSGECIAYILGRKEFYGLEFQVNPSVLVPRPDTETLVEVALGRIGSGESGVGSRDRPIRVLDLCTGSGAVAIALKHTMPELEVWAADISAEALETAKTNASRLLPSDSIRFLQGDLYDALLPSPQSPLIRPPLMLKHSRLIRHTVTFNWAPAMSHILQTWLDAMHKLRPSFLIPHSSFLIIVSNPPYIPSADLPSLPPEVRMEPALALDGGGDGLDVIKKIVSIAPGFLCPGGSLLLEADPRQMAAIASLYKEAGFSDIQTYKDLSVRERVIGGVIPKKETRRFIDRS